MAKISYGETVTWPPNGTPKQKGLTMKTVTLKQLAKTLNLIADSDISSGQYQELLQSGKFTELLREFIESGKPSVDIFKVVLDYDMTLRQMIEAAKYDWMNDDITEEHFPFNKRENGEVELHVVHFGRDIRTKEVLARLDERGLRPAELPELLALGATHPNLQRDYPLVALGSEWRNPGGGVDYAILGERGDRRNLLLIWSGSDDEWHDYYRFVAVSK